MSDPPIPEYDHCNGPECFKYDGSPVDVCACECDRCIAAREWLLRAQGEADDPDSGANGAGPLH